MALASKARDKMCAVCGSVFKTRATHVSYCDDCRIGINQPFMPKPIHGNTTAVVCEACNGAKCKACYNTGYVWQDKVMVTNTGIDVYSHRPAIKNVGYSYRSDPAGDWSL